MVAGEVRNLAQRSAGAAREIKGLIEDSLGKVDAGSVLVTQSGTTLDDIVGSVKRVTDIIGEIAAASGEQTTGIDQVNRAVTQMDQVVQSNAAQTEQLSSTAQALSEQAAKLQSLVGRFKLGEQRAVRTVAAAPAPPSHGPVKPLAVRPTRPSVTPELAGAHAGNGHQHDGFEEF